MFNAAIANRRAMTSGNTITGAGFINRRAEIRQRSLAVNLNRYGQDSVTTRIRHPQPP